MSEQPKGSRGGERVRLVAVLLALGLTASTSGSPVTGGPAHIDTSPPAPPASFALVSEIYGDGAAEFGARLRDGLANGVSMHPTLSPTEREVVAGDAVPFVYFSVPTEAGVGGCYPASADDDTARTVAELERSTRAVWRLGAPEFDQSGGCWAQGRPSMASLTDENAYESWARFYLDEKGLRPYLEASVAERGYRWMSLCVYAFCPQYAFDIGSDAVLLERNNDELGGLSPGLAMLRGAARQHGDREWGVDVSTYRYWNGGPTVFDDAGRLVTGWSPSTFERHMYVAYMAGAYMLHNETADYFAGAPEGGLNPLGTVVRDFANFSLRRHPDRGTSYIPMAILQDHLSGFEPRFGEFDQAPLKWYRNNSYTTGDRMLTALLDLAYPGHHTWGTIVPGAPWKIIGPDGGIDVGASQAAYRRSLTSGADPRRWEPMGSTRWGESLDVITDRASLDALLRYRVVVLATSGPVGPRLLAALEEYVSRGGTVVLNAEQAPTAEALTGVRTTDQRRSTDWVTWLHDGSVTRENLYDYQVVVADAATVLASTPSGDPVVTRRDVGAGAVYVTTPAHLLDAGGTVLDSGRRLLDALYTQVAKVAVVGPPLQYLVNTDGPKTIVTLVNIDVAGATWNGTLRFPGPSGSEVAREWTRDTTVPTTVVGGETVVEASVPPYGVRVYALETGD